MVSAGCRSTTSFETAYNVDGVPLVTPLDDLSTTTYDVENNSVRLPVWRHAEPIACASRLTMPILVAKSAFTGMTSISASTRRHPDRPSRKHAAAAGTDDMNVSGSDTVAGRRSANLDLGLGLRITHACSIRGGYRLMGITGVVDAARRLCRTCRRSAERTTPSLWSRTVNADDSLTCLHGGYVGLTYNW